MAARGGFAASVRSARDAVVGNSSLRSYVWILGLAALVTAVGLAVDGRPLPAAVLLLAAGALLWLGGGFALPRTPEAHQRRVAFIYRGWAGGSQRAYDEFARRRERRAREAERLVLSPGLEEQRQRILEALETGGEGGPERRRPLAGRARRAAGLVGGGGGGGRARRGPQGAGARMHPADGSSAGRNPDSLAGGRGSNASPFVVAIATHFRLSPRVRPTAGGPVPTYVGR